MFGTVFTMNSQQKIISFLQLRDQFLCKKTTMIFQSYFTSRCVKKPAEGTQDFKKTWQMEILDLKIISAAILKNSCACEKV